MRGARWGVTGRRRRAGERPDRGGEGEGVLGPAGRGWGAGGGALA